MGFGYHVFIVNDDNSLHRIPFVKYERLYREDSQERLLEYAEQKVRSALLILLVEERESQSIA